MVKPELTEARLSSPTAISLWLPFSPNGTTKLTEKAPPLLACAVSAGTPPEALRKISTGSLGANPLPLNVIDLPALTAYGRKMVLGYRPIIWYGTVAVVWVLVPTSTNAVGPTGAIPTWTLALLIDPLLSAVKVAAGVPLTRPQNTLTFSPGPNPLAVTVMWSPGFPAALPTILAEAIPPGVTSGAVAWTPSAWRTTTVAFEAVKDNGMLNPVVTVPLPVVWPCATTFAARGRDVCSDTTTLVFRSKPFPAKPTWPPGDTRPGSSAMTGPPPAATRWPPRVTVGVGVGAGADVLGAADLPACFP